MADDSSTDTPERSATAPTQRVEISEDDLPLFCPMDSMSLWDSHPRVYLPIAESGEERCPYCGTVYVLIRRGGGDG